MVEGGKDNRSFRQVRRSKKRKFTGNRYTNKALQDTLETIVNVSVDTSSEGQNINEKDVEFSVVVGPHSDVASSSHISEDVPTVSQKKLQVNLDELSTTLCTDSKAVDSSTHLLDLKEGIKYQIMDMGILSDVIECLACPECSTVGIQLPQSKSRQGLAIEYFLRCTNVDCSWEKTFFPSIKPEHCRSFDINKRIIYAMRRIGVGLAGIKTFLALMDLPSPMSHSAYDKLSNKIHKAVKDVAVEVMKEAAEEVHMLTNVPTDIDKSETCLITTESTDVNMDFSTILDEVSGADDNIVNTSVSVDGTWQKGGFSSLNGTMAAISIDTGKVLDFEIMSRYCQACVTNAPLEEKKILRSSLIFKLTIPLFVA